ncbi:damage-control phosphatase ARMT1 family protein [Geofilum sp. OHC36d9]|uniref:damage-control phosphatase ARMT1 family protein n=1 Tax=Geofilum sp. OHC36d9 TaxID=3458413 RepID=UPI0040346FE4
MHPNCIQCHQLQADKLFLKHHISQEESEKITTSVQQFIDDRDQQTLISPEVSRFVHNKIKEAAGIEDLYAVEKQHYNELMMGFEDEIRNRISRSAQPFETALRYALAGNIIDFGPPQSFDVVKTLSEAAAKIPAIDHSEALYEALQKANTVLYLGDNAGEIVLDKLFIETIHHPNLYFATRGSNVINDITLKDAESTGMNAIAKVISNGDNAPSTILKTCSAEFQEIFKKADVIISKGQGNLEGLIHEKNYNIFFLLMVKCQVIGDIIGVKKGNSVVYHHKKDGTKSNIK